MKWSEGTKRDDHKDRATMEPLWERNRCFEDVVKWGGSTCGSDVTPTAVGTFIPGQGGVSFALSQKVQDASQSEIPQNPEPP